VGPRTDLDGCGKSLLHEVSIPGPSGAQVILRVSDKEDSMFKERSFVAVTIIGGGD